MKRISSLELALILGFTIEVFFVLITLGRDRSFGPDSSFGHLLSLKKGAVLDVVYSSFIASGHGPLPRAALNNPPQIPRYNGDIEISIRDFKTALGERLQRRSSVPANFALAAELTAHDLYHLPRRCLTMARAARTFPVAPPKAWADNRIGAGRRSPPPPRVRVVEHGGTLAPLPEPDPRPAKPETNSVNHFPKILVSEISGAHNLQGVDRTAAFEDA